jgi:hypothetical protein
MAQFYQSKEEAIEAANNMIESNDLTGVLRPSAIVQTITLNQIHSTLINGDDRRSFMVLWPQDEDLITFHKEADSKRMEIDDRYAALKQKMTEMEAENEWLLSPPKESADKVIETQPPADPFKINQSENGEFEVKTQPSWA